MQSSRALFEAAAPLLGKRGSRSEREQNFEHLRRHWLESASASPTTAEGKKERKKHTDIIKRMRHECPEAVDFMLTTPRKAQRALVEMLEALATPEGIARAAAASVQEMEVDPAADGSNSSAAAGRSAASELALEAASRRARASRSAQHTSSGWRTSTSS